MAINKLFSESLKALKQGGAYLQLVVNEAAEVAIYMNVAMVHVIVLQRYLTRILFFSPEKLGYTQSCLRKTR